MTRVLQIAIIILLLAGCQKQTGYSSVDRWIVTNYQDRVALTQGLQRSTSYCKFGPSCEMLCAKVPEPKNHWDQYVANSEKYDELKERASINDLLLTLPKPQGPVISIMTMEPITNEAEISRVKLECLTDQHQQLEKIERLLEKLVG